MENPRPQSEGLLRFAPLAISLVALGVSFEALERSSPVSQPVVRPTEETALEARPTPRASSVAPLPPRAIAASAPAVMAALVARAPAASDGVGRPSPLTPVPALRDRAAPKPQSAALNAMAKSLRVRPQALADLADWSGEVPAALAAKLERAQKAGAAVAAQAGLEAAKGDIAASILVDFVIRSAREGHSGDPNALDVQRAAKADALSAIRSGCGAAAEAPAATVLDTL